MNKTDLDILWVLISTALVLLMQAGFLCLESGLTRSKNAINVAMKNLSDFIVAVSLYWLVGFGLMFGTTWFGLTGSALFMVPVGAATPWLSTFFLFQTMFCATAATIVSGAIAERTRFRVYIMLSMLVVGVIYPLFGHWAWGGSYQHQFSWLHGLGFVDFAGSTVVHSVGGWVALAALLQIGPRAGRFIDGKPQDIPASNTPLAMLGVMLFVVGWFGFNGGSTLALNGAIPGIIANTLLAATAGAVTASLLGSRYWAFKDKTMLPMNGTLAGLVAITAGCHAVDSVDAVVIGAVGGGVMLLADNLLIRYQIDDAIGAVPVHLAAGMWGTVAVGLFGNPETLGTGLSRLDQTGVQLLGVLTCGLWSFSLAYIAIRFINRMQPLRVSEEEERIGLNVSEHGAKTALIELLGAMEQQEQSKDLALRVPVEPFTEVGQIASKYNHVMDSLEKAIARTRMIIRDIRDGIITFTKDGVLTSFNPGAEQIFGTPAAVVLGRHMSLLFHDSPPLLSSDGLALEKLLPTDGKVYGSYELTGRRIDTNQAFHMELTVSEGRAGDETIYTGLVRDVTDRKHIEEQLFAEKELAQVTLESIGDAVITTDGDARVTYFNQVAEKLTGWRDNQVLGEPLEQVLRLRDAITGKPVLSVIPDVLKRHVVLTKSSTYILQRPDHVEFAIQFTAAPIKNRGGQVVGTVVVFHDVTDAKRMEEQLSYQATHDALTGLLNRREFETKVGELIGRAKLERNRHVLCYLDLDQFKLVNDTCGHMAGDELLRQVALLLKEQLRASDTLARLGGDEFGIVLYDCEIGKGVEIANQLRETIHEFRFPWKDKIFSIGLSIGLVAVTEQSEGLSEVLSLADAACYAAKDMGRDRIHVHQPDDVELARRHGQMQWASRIQRAIDEDRLRLYFQPIVPINNVAGAPGDHYEIFVRMLDEENNVVPPGAFIPAAERYNLMSAIDQWVVRNTLAWLGDYHAHASSNIAVCAINLSGVSIGHETFLKEIKEQFKRYNVPPELICFEITETAAMADLAKATHFISELNRLGCRFALDDFGSGLSSFGYLKHLPVNFLKIDGIFVKDIHANRVDRAMVESINSIGHIMGLKTIAEFVESEATLRILREMGIDYVQGYHLGRPRPLEQLESVRFMPR